MSGNVTLAELRNSAMDRADMNGQGLVSQATWNEYINKSKDRLYDLLISAYGADYYVADPYEISLISGTERYALPTDYYKTIKVEYKIDRDNSFVLRRFSPSSKNRSSILYPYGRDYGYEYREMGDYLYIYPVPSGNASLNLWYVPLSTNLTSDSDELKGFNGWEEYIIIDVAVKALRKEESDTADLERDLIRLKVELQEMAEERNLGEAHKILDVTRPLRDVTLGGFY